MSKYDMPMETDLASIPGKIIAQIAPGSLVLELGCATGRMTRYMKEELGCHVSVIEIDSAAFSSAMQYAEDGFCGDLESDGWIAHFSGKLFDVILIADVLEHLRCPEKVLAATKELLRDDGKVLISLPNIAHHDILVNLLQNRFEYTNIGLLDNTHVHFWAKNNLPALAEQTGYSIRILDGNCVPAGHTEQNVGPKILTAMELTLSAREHGTVYQFFLVLQKEEWMRENGISFEDRLAPNPFFDAHVYWDTGAGYTAGEYARISPRILENGRLSFRCDTLPVSCQKVRFDPTLGHLCTVRDLQVVTDKGACDCVPLNGVTVNGVTVFAGTDPQMEFSLPAGAAWFEIEADIRRCDAGEYAEIFAAAQQAPVTDELRQRLDAAQQEISAAHSALSQLQADIQSISKEKAQLEQDLAQAQEETQALLQKEQDAASEIQQLHAALSTAQNALNAEKEAVLAQQNRAAVAEQQLHDLVNSQCWKLTAPLRFVLDAMKRTRFGCLIHKGFRSLRQVGFAGTLRKVFCRRRTPAVTVSAEDISFRGLVRCVTAHGGQVYLPESIEKLNKVKSGKKILFISHELDLTGAPIVLRNFAVSAKEHGDHPVMISRNDGNLRSSVTDAKIPTVVYPDIYSSDLIQQYASLFDFVVVNTIVGSPIITMLRDTATPVLWWIHEAECSYYKEMLEQIPMEQPDNVNIYCVGTYAKKLLLQHRPAFRPEILLYHTLDFTPDASVASPVTRDDRITFAVVGTMQERKGQDILAKAILQLPPQLIEKCRFLFIGRAVDETVMHRVNEACRRYPENVRYLGELPNDVLLSLYQSVDCLVCSSRDDPMPCTITEVLLLSTPVICSENTGYAPILEEMGSGLVYRNNDPALLAAELRRIAEKQVDLDAMRKLARETYETHFSQAVFAANSQKAIADTVAASQALRRKSVSVVIPAYNAGEEGPPLFETLQAQEGLDELEIIVVDSESRDGTADMARKYGCKVIEIKQRDFSHSYARNLGAQAAKGDYLLFMTQDALPMTKDWICRLVTAAQENHAVAVSCRQDPKPDCDLFGKVSLWLHNSFMEILEHDRVTERPNPWTYESARKNGQLDDVSCLIKRSIFAHYQYRGNYAEDLDLGLRLIRDGYRLALLSSAPVRHSHTRPAMYHFRRTIVDVAALKRIMPEMPVQDVTEQQALNRIFTAAAAMLCSVRSLAAQKSALLAPALLRSALPQIFRQAEDEAKSVTAEKLLESVKQGLPCDDGGTLALIPELLALTDTVSYDPALLPGVTSFICDPLMTYLEQQQAQLTEEDILSVCDTVIKRFGQMSGIAFAEFSMTEPVGDSPTHQLIEKYSKGI